jgi:hypothetical protein
MLCPQCLYEIQEPPPLRADYDRQAAFDLDRKGWEAETGYGTREFTKSKCRCLRCQYCWGHVQGGCVCNKGGFRVRLPRQEAPHGG